MEEISNGEREERVNRGEMRGKKDPSQPSTCSQKPNPQLANQRGPIELELSVWLDRHLAYLSPQSSECMCQTLGH